MSRLVFVQSELLPDVAVLEVDPEITPAGLHVRLMALLPESERSQVRVYIEDDDAEDAFGKLEEVIEGLRLHLHRERVVDVTVHYAGRKVMRAFRPSATVSRVKKWAAHEFGISPSDAAEMALQKAGSDLRPDPDTHIGTLVVSPLRHLDFNLVPSPRVNG